MTVRINSRPPELPGDRQRPSLCGKGGVTGGVKRLRGGAALVGRPFGYGYDDMIPSGALRSGFASEMPPAWRSSGERITATGGGDDTGANRRTTTSLEGSKP